MIKQPVLFAISLLLVPVVLYFVAARVMFLANAKEATGSVVSVSGRNDSCGSKRNRYSCTEFKALVQYFSDSGERGEISVGAGSARGHNQHLSKSSYQTGSKVPIRYNPQNLAQAYRDSMFDIWGAPVVAFFMQIATLFGSFAQKRQRGFQRTF